ncbi:MAG: glycosyltransferase family 2 protein [bacterium]|jgi:glycosyltransferase involved in cell wall biosynthesis|nr:glycosyltransferase family 2 protein [candidate division KSB1 bacterium]MDH7558804.1 glycosyltransferase family 2 protein [bacterium]
MGGQSSWLPISVVVITRDEEDNIEGCLESVQWADDIVVVDAESRDRTVELCRKFTQRVFRRPWPGYAAQKAFAVAQARHEWVLSLDADERVSDALRAELATLIALRTECDGYYVPRLSSYLGKWIRRCGWYPGYQLRFFRKSKVGVAQSRVHEGFIVQGKVGYLRGELLHYSYRDLEENLQKLNRYSTLEALDRAAQTRVRWYDFVLHPLSEFLRKFVALGGTLEGTHGFVLCAMSAFQKMALYMKIWQLQHREQLMEAYQRAGAPRCQLEAVGDDASFGDHHHAQ